VIAVASLSPQSPVFETVFNDFAFGSNGVTDTRRRFPDRLTCLKAGSRHPVNEIILKNGVLAVIEPVVAGDAANSRDDVVLHHGDTGIVLTAYRAIDVQDYWFMLG
jgi:hypothetical protein